MNPFSSVRRAAFAGSWYEANGNKLAMEIASNIQKACKDIPQITQLKAIIGPHAGFRFSGPTLGWSYQYLDPSKVKRIFLLGPSHRSPIRGCALSSCSQFQTPFGTIDIDSQTVNQLQMTEAFETTSKQTEEAEHSLELHLPFIKKIMGDAEFKLVPIMVGQTNQETEKEYGTILSKYLDDNDTLFIISSDFCHWGERFRYTYYDSKWGKIYQSIEQLDRRGMQAIETQNPGEFSKYLKETENTICGRRCISILLNAFQNSKYSKQMQTKFVKYDQSGQVEDFQDSSVSYATSISYI